MTKSTNFNSEYFLDVINRLEEINGQLLELKNVWMPEAERRELDKFIECSNHLRLASVPYVYFEVHRFEADIEMGIFSYLHNISYLQIDYFKRNSKRHLIDEINAFELIIEN